MRDQEEALKDQAAAKIDQGQVKQDQLQIKLQVAYLIKDGITPNEKSLFSVKIFSAQMTVNDKKQTDKASAGYKTKYPRFATGNFSYSDNLNGNRTMHMNR